jgi:predicted DNA binding CopG/RHH family protein
MNSNFDPEFEKFKDYDFADAKSAEEIPALAKLQAETAKGKTRITLYIDEDVIAAFREKAAAEGKDYQRVINEVLRAAVAPDSAPVTVETLRRVLREELRAG